MNTETKPHQRYPNFDWLRLLLALLVVISHVNSASGFNAVIPLSIPMVPAFLALSGFLILQSWENSRGFLHFWKKRGLRVLPAMFMSLILVAILNGWQPFRDSVICYVTLGLNTDYSGNAPLWSLGCEEILYLVLSSLAMLGVYKKAPYVLFPALLAAITLYACTLTLHNHVQRITQLPAAFLLGNIAYVYRKHIVLFANKFGWQFATIAVAIRVLEQMAQGWTISSVNAPGHYLIFCAVVSGILLVGLSSSSAKPLAIDLSYGCYVFHWPIMKKLLAEGITGPTLFPACLTLTLIASWLSWKYVESPCLRLKNADFPIFGKVRPTN